MIDFLGFIYDLAKDLKAYFKWEEEEKLIDSNWVKKSGFQDKAENDGLTLRWSNPDKIQTRMLDGYDVVYEIDESKRMRRRLVNKVGDVLIGKRS